MRSIVCMLLCGLFVISSAARSADAQYKWKAGAARVKITPKESMWMAGYASRKTPSEGWSGDLFAKAIVIEDEASNQLVIITMDLITVPRPLREQVAQELQQRFKLKPGNLMMNCSHTHCGPVVRDNVETMVLYPVDAVHAERIERYFVELKNNLIALVTEAFSNLEPVTLGYSYARCGFAMNRRLPSPTGYQNSPYPDGPVDQAVPVLRVESMQKKLKAVLFGYACHNTTTAVMQYNADYAGYAQEALERNHDGVVAMFVMGCGGDQNPYPRGKLEMASTHGESLASAVETALLPAPEPITGPLKIAYEEIDLPFVPLSREEILQRKKSSDAFEQRRADLLLAEFDRVGHARESYPYPVQTIRFGDSLTMIALGGEVVVDYSLRLKQMVKGRVWVAGYSNDVMAYIPSERVLSEGGYEGGGAMRYSNLPNPWRSGIEDRILSTVQSQLQR